MSPQKRPVSDYDWQETVVTQSDFQNGEDESTSVAAGSNPAEVMYFEVGDDNGVSSQVASYRVVRPGGSQGSNPRSGRGKIYADIDSDDSNTDTVQTTQIRLIKRPLNGDNRTILTEWMTLRDLEASDVEDRMRLEPITNSQGDPLVIREGDVVGVEARNSSSSFKIDRDGSTLELPFQVGY